ncbi:TIGR02453 family protein [Acanthopleuribacter pedis]|uniref:DUF2461 domain-containing protein n=1 Tax=Acanthopleuribacter pedis TaxID=442870 RepID=A0A8J7Q3W3_9BACT|nr:DUF2461 domain-containing protein [Acanthopleuribacter pedis]
MSLSQCVPFFQELSANNEKTWFHANKPRFEKEIKGPFTDLVQIMIMLIGQEGPPLAITPKDAMFRIYRDVRFSKDKTPYKTHVGAVIAPGGRKDPGPGFYFQIGAEGLFAAGGCFQPGKNELLAIRRAIAKEPEVIGDLTAAPAFKETFGALKGNRNKILPKEFKPVLATQPLIANKQFYYAAELGCDWLDDERLPQRLLEIYRIGKPLNDYLAASLRV